MHFRVPLVEAEPFDWVAGGLNSALKVSIVTLSALYVIQVRDEHRDLKNRFSSLDTLSLWCLQICNLLQSIRMSPQCLQHLARAGKNTKTWLFSNLKPSALPAPVWKHNEHIKV
ncbi:hypothetical protein E2C01_039530 [Portunus trituberculatus]|uniref:Uncharacterized protein n=1 Tax=Portunus trituberculatus TaxID=210409 RepID=A0A5B7FNA3_PORTR|nr:hypothetical protein [Portunus trituberculatus]